MMHLLQVTGQQADALVSPEHGIMVTLSTALAFGLDYLHSAIRKRQRSETIEDEVKKAVTAIMDRRAWQDSKRETLLDTDLSLLKEGQESMEAQIRGVNTQLEAMRFGIFRMLAAIKPELVKDLDLGGPKSG
jgi:hypothetical protein